jgi:hypothetical protein
MNSLAPQSHDTSSARPKKRKRDETEENQKVIIREQHTCRLKSLIFKQIQDSADILNANGLEFVNPTTITGKNLELLKNEKIYDSKSIPSKLQLSIQNPGKLNVRLKAVIHK